MWLQSHSLHSLSLSLTSLVLSLCQFLLLSFLFLAFSINFYSFCTIHTFTPEDLVLPFIVLVYFLFISRSPTTTTRRAYFGISIFFLTVARGTFSSLSSQQLLCAYYVIFPWWISGGATPKWLKEKTCNRRIVVSIPE